MVRLLKGERATLLWAKHPTSLVLLFCFFFGLTILGLLGKMFYFLRLLKQIPENQLLLFVFMAMLDRGRRRTTFSFKT